MQIQIINSGSELVIRATAATLAENITSNSLEYDKSITVSKFLADIRDQLLATDDQGRSLIQRTLSEAHESAVQQFEAARK